MVLEDSMNIIQKIKLLNKINKAVKQAKKVSENHSQLAIDLEKAILNLKADFEVLAGLLPSLKGVYKDIKALLDAK